MTEGESRRTKLKSEEFINSMKLKYVGGGLKTDREKYSSGILEGATRETAGWSRRASKHHQNAYPIGHSPLKALKQNIAKQYQKHKENIKKDKKNSTFSKKRQNQRKNSDQRSQSKSFSKQRTLNREISGKKKQVTELPGSRCQLQNQESKAIQQVEFTPSIGKSKRMDFYTIRQLENNSSPIKRFFNSSANSTQLSNNYSREILPLSENASAGNNFAHYRMNRNDLQFKLIERANEAKLDKQKNESSICNVENLLNVIRSALRSTNK